MEPSRAIGLADLPDEIIQEIHLLSLSPALPLASRQFRHILGGSTAHVARFFLTLYLPYGPDQILARALPHRIVDLDVVREMERQWDRRRAAGGDDEREAQRRDSGVQSSSNTGASTSRSSEPPAARTRPRPLRCAVLPRRIFRARPAPGAPDVDPLVAYLIDDLRADVNDRNGYALARAVLNGATGLVRFLLARGAEPGLNGSLAVQAAIERGDLAMVRLLVERIEDGTPAVAAASVGKRKRDGDEGGDGAHLGAGVSPAAPGKKAGRAKKARLEDRVRVDASLVEKAMRRKADDIVDYFVHVKGVMPKLRNIMAMSDPLTRSLTPPRSKRRPQGSS